jgi:anti-sigma B factor antagonist
MTPVSVTTGDDGGLDLLLRGELDYTNAARITEVIRAAVERSGAGVVRADLTEVTFLDSSGIGVLVNAMKAAQALGADFRVRGPNPKVFDQLRITGLIDLFPVEET